MNIQKLKKLMTQRELQAVLKSRENLAKKDIKGLLSRVREFRNKYRDLDRRQSKKGAELSSNKRTKDKIKAFESVLGRLDSKLKKAKSFKNIALQKKPARRARGTKAAKPRLGTKGLKRMKPKIADSMQQGEGLLSRDLNLEIFSLQSPPVKQKQAELAYAPKKRILGHISSRNKRMQKKRDIKNA